MKHINIPIFIPHAGCPFTCIFCNQRQIAAQLEPLSPSSIPQLLDRHLATIPPGSEIEIAFYGGSFTMMDISLQEAYLSQVSPYLRQGLVQGLRLSTRPDGIDPFILRMLKDRGVETVELGVQSWNDEVLAAAGRGTDREQASRACVLLKEYGFKLGIQLMVGLPGDDPGKDLESTLATIGHKPDMVRIYPVLVIAGTELARQWETGRYQPLSLQEAVAITADMLLLFQYCHVPVIRLGLQPSQELQCSETLLAGPYHPAFGELVEQHIFYRQAGELLKIGQPLSGGRDQINLLVHPRDVSKLIGQHRGNIHRLQEKLGTARLKVVQHANLDPNDIALSLDGDEAILVLKRSEFTRGLMDQGVLPRCG